MVWDVFDFEKYTSKEGSIYDRKRNPFDIKKASPLGRVPGLPLPLGDVGGPTRRSRAHRSEFYNPHDLQCSKPGNL